MPDAPADVRLRPARPDDAPQAARLIYAAGPTLFDALFGPRKADVLRLFDALFRLPRNPFSFEMGIVAEQDGEVVGVALAGTAAERRRIERRLFWLMPRLRGPIALLRCFPNVLTLMTSGGPSPPESRHPDTYYLGILSVSADRRGQGIGSRLLDEVRRRAEAAGSVSLTLHAEIHNHGAQRLYARHGYVEMHRTETPRAVRFGVSGFITMVCRLDGAAAPSAASGEQPSTAR
jgi:ribosomal protein S18 acetylase RimI-like enzyme